MRELKFRAWDETNKKMWYTHEEANSIGDWTFMFTVGNGVLQALIYGREHLVTDDPFPMYDVEEQVLPIMQFTGLKDKNGKEIYESDIVIGNKWWVKSDGYLKKKYPEKINVLCQVVFKGGKFRTEFLKPTDEHKEAYENNNYRGIEYSLDVLVHEKPLRHIEIIGNIYENPDLLGESDV